MAKKRKEALKGTEGSRSFAMMNIWPEEQPKKVSTAIWRLGISPALSSKAGHVLVPKGEVRSEQAPRTATKTSKPAKRTPYTEAQSEQSRGAAAKESATPNSREKLDEAVRREHAAWVRWARTAKKAASPGLKKMTKAQKRKLRKSKPEFEGKARFAGGFQFSQGGLPTLGKRR